MAGQRGTGLDSLARGLDSQPSASTEMYESAEEHDGASFNGSRAHSFSGPRRSTDWGGSLASGASTPPDTASTAHRGPPGSLDVPQRSTGADAAAMWLQAASLEEAEARNGPATTPPHPPAQQGAQPPAAADAAEPTAEVKQGQERGQEQEQEQQPAAGSSVAADVSASADAPTVPSSAAESAPAAAPLNGVGESGGALPPGAALFSVPMSTAPNTGIYGIPQEMFRIRDLDAGKEYSLDQRYWIKDMDTGTVYVLESEAGQGGPDDGGRVTELLSGKELSLNEFEDTLGFFKVPQPAPRPQHMLASTGAAGAAAGAAAIASVQQAAQKSLKSFSSGASWVKSNVGSMLSSLKSGGSGGQPGEPARTSSGGGESATSGGGGGGGVAVDSRGGGGAAGPAAQPFFLDDRQGQPVKVQVYRKSYKEFTDLRLVQQLGGHQGVVWAMKFSRNGKFLATAGQDCVVRVWEVAPSRGSSSTPSTPVESDVPLDDAAAATAAAAGGSSGGAGDGGLLADPSVAVFQQRPYRVYRGHKQDVLDLCWSKTQFLLSASMDKTVRLWHISMDECLRVFKHSDFVTAIDFHPLDDKMFLSGSIDGKVRLWNIPEQRVVSWQDVHEMVTAVTYSPDGRKAVVGTMKGKCRFYTIDKSTLEYEAQLDVKNKRGQHSRGKKITGLTFLPSEPGKLLITSNDSRVRLYDGYTLRCKYKGHTNRNTQIRATFSPAGDYITCGSDDGWVYVWGTRKTGMPVTGAAGSGGSSSGAAGGGGSAGGSATGGSSAQQQEADHPLAKEKNASYECFQANGDIVTVAIFAPTSCHRSADSLSPRADSQRYQRDDSLGDAAEGEAALATARARGQVLVTAGYTGEIRIYENIGLPQWL